jgi:hypothetical protein
MDLLTKMTAIEQHAVTDRVQAQTAPTASLHAEVHESRKSGNPKPQEQPTNALDAFGQFSIGFANGLGSFVHETVSTAGQAITDPQETVQHAIDGTKTAVQATIDATGAGANYIANKVSHGDLNGMTQDAIYTGEAIGTVAAKSLDHFNHLSAQEKGYVFGHDVAPTVIGTVLAPELVPEGALVAGAEKIMAVAGTLIKEEAAAAKIAGVLEHATEKIFAISEKMATLNKKMEDLLHKEKGVIHAVEDFEGPRDKVGTIARGRSMSKEFKDELDNVPLTDGEREFLKRVTYQPVHNMAESISADHVFANGTWSKDMNILRVAEHNGFENDLRRNKDVAHTLHHEIGHAVNDYYGDRSTRPFKPVSSHPSFVEQFEKDLAENPTEAFTARARLEARYPGDIEAQWHEVWADMFAHVSGSSNTEYSQQLRKAFPGYFEKVRDFRTSIGV